jgi:hypothetical protein
LSRHIFADPRVSLPVKLIVGAHFVWAVECGLSYAIATASRLFSF